MERQVELEKLITVLKKRRDMLEASESVEHSEQESNEEPTVLEELIGAVTDKSDLEQPSEKLSMDVLKKVVSVLLFTIVIMFLVVTCNRVFRGDVDSGDQTGISLFLE